MKKKLTLDFERNIYYSRKDYEFEIIFYTDKQNPFEEIFYSVINLEMTDFNWFETGITNVCLKEIHRKSYYKHNYVYKINDAKDLDFLFETNLYKKLIGKQCLLKIK